MRMLAVDACANDGRLISIGNDPYRLNGSSRRFGWMGLCVEIATSKSTTRTLFEHLKRTIRSTVFQSTSTINLNPISGCGFEVVDVHTKSTSTTKSTTVKRPSQAMSLEVMSFEATL